MITDTLEAQLKRPGTIKRDMGFMKISKVVGALNHYMGVDDFVTEAPEDHALTFYSTNHVMSEVLSRNDKESPLNNQLELVDYYQSTLSKISIRMFYYLLLICTRESRHVGSDYPWEKNANLYGDRCCDFTQSLSNCGSSGAVNALRQITYDFEIGYYTKHLFDIFNIGDFPSGYGGKAWADVALVLSNFVNGIYSAEMMMDTAFTLCHNNGPIFNKGMLYDQYNSSEIQKILDVQRSGQIPQLVKEGSCIFVNKKHTDCITNSEQVLDHNFGDYVDWYKVEVLGAMGSYPKQKKNQTEVHGLPDNMQQIEDQNKAKQYVQQLKEAQIIKDNNSKFLEIMPGVKIPKVKLDRCPF